jgi:hypothetical protein
LSLCLLPESFLQREREDSDKAISQKVWQLGCCKAIILFLKHT